MDCCAQLSDEMASRVFGHEDLSRSIQFESELGDERGAAPA
jgi:hypothetical protein